MGRDPRVTDHPLPPRAPRSPANPSVQVTVGGNDDMAAPGISVGVADVDAVHAKAVEHGFEIVYPLRDEEWGVRRFLLREPSGTVVNVVPHRAELPPADELQSRSRD